MLALKGSYLVCSELGGFCVSDGRSQPVVVVVVAWLSMASYGFLWRRRLASYGLLAWASYGRRRRLGFRLQCVLAMLACNACSASLQCFLAMLGCSACLCFTVSGPRAGFIQGFFPKQCLH